MNDKVEATSWGELALEMIALVIGGLVISLMLATTMISGVRLADRDAQKEKPSKVVVVERPADRPGHDGAKN